MKPVYQEFIHLPEQGQHGDCQRAVIASLLELPISEVPHFAQIAQGDASVYWDEIQRFLAPRGYAWLVVKGWGFYGEHGDIYHEISGPSPRGNGVSHAVVGMNGEMVFDPHPTGAGLAGPTNEWQFGFLVRTGTGKGWL